jgi:hypothetical protein
VPGWRGWIAAAAAVLVLGALGGGWTIWRFGRPAAEDRVIRFQIPPPEGTGEVLHLRILVGWLDEILPACAVSQEEIRTHRDHDLSCGQSIKRRESRT